MQAGYSKQLPFIYMFDFASYSQRRAYGLGTMVVKLCRAIFLLLIRWLEKNWHERNMAIYEHKESQLSGMYLYYCILFIQINAFMYSDEFE